MMLVNYSQILINANVNFAVFYFFLSITVIEEARTIFLSAY